MLTADVDETLFSLFPVLADNVLSSSLAARSFEGQQLLASKHECHHSEA